MTREEREIALYCLKASSDYHLEVCEECAKYPNCDHTIQDDITETIIKELKQEPCEDAISRRAVMGLLDEYYAELTLDETALKSNAIAVKVTRHIINDIEALPSVNPKPIECKDAISREEVIKASSKLCVSDECCKCQFDENTKCRLKSYRNYINSLPSVNPTRPKTDAIPIEWLKEKLVNHPELSYALTDGIINVLDFWESDKESEDK